jgi:hypothetical protein
VVGTDEHGRFTFDQLSPAVQYTVTAQLPGFGTTTRDGIIVPPAGSLSVSLLLDPGCLRRGVPLTAYVPPLEQLITADLVAHIRVAEDAHDLDVMHGRSCSRYDAAPATILEIVAPARGPWRPGTAVNVYSYLPVRAGNEYIAFLWYNDAARHYLLDDPNLAIKVTGGRVEWKGSYIDTDSVETLGIPERAPIDLALARLRETYATHTRFRPLGAPGSEAPLEALVNRTGWFELGSLEGDRDVWIDWTPPEWKPAPIPPPFEFVGAKDPSQTVPRRGDRIRLRKAGIIKIDSFASRGEDLRERPPTAWNRQAFTVNLTGTRVGPGREYTVADVVIQTFPAGDSRYVWVRLVAD